MGHLGKLIVRLQPIVSSVCIIFVLGGVVRKVQMSELLCNTQKPIREPDTGPTANKCVILPEYGEYCMLNQVCIDKGGIISGYEVKLKKDDAISNLANFPIAAPDINAHFPSRAWVNVQTDRDKWSELWSKCKIHSSIYVTGFDDPSGENPFHYAESVMPFFSFLKREDVEHMNDAVLFRSKPKIGSWIAGFEAQVFSNMTVQYSSELEHAMCAERVVVGGTIISLLEGAYHAELFRTLVYRRLMIIPRKISERVRVTLLQRTKRFLTNSLDMESMLRMTGALIRVENLDELTFSEQVELMSSTDLLISPHGAGLTNIIFMQQERAVIELFPSKLWYYELYGKIARNAGLFYAYVLGEETQPDVSSIRECFSTACADNLKRNFHVDLDVFLPTLLHSFSWLGFKPNPIDSR